MHVCGRQNASCVPRTTTLNRLRLPCGRGHASEKPELPAALAETASRIRFLGPPAAAMAALGDKVPEQRPSPWR